MNNNAYNENREFVEMPVTFDKLLRLGKTSLDFPQLSYQEYIEGSYWYNNVGELIQIIRYIDRDNVEIFYPQYDYYSKLSMSAIRKGAFKSPFYRGSCGGYIGIGKYNLSDKMINSIYQIWMGMLKRVIKRKEYSNVTIDNEWYCFEDFCDWYYNKIILLNPNYKYSIDKDVKQLGYNDKVYSKYTCMLIPYQINALIKFMESDINTGIRMHCNKYEVRIGSVFLSKNICEYYDSLEDAINRYKFIKYDIFDKEIEYYYYENALLVDDYNYLKSISINNKVFCS